MLTMRIAHLNRLLPSRKSASHLRPRFSQASKQRAPVVLGIETSCDDTAIAVVSADREILYSASTSQWTQHWREYKGINPALALREHEIEWQKKNPEFLPSRDLSAVAVTSGPGLALALGVGVRIAREFAVQHNLSLLGINHLAAHNLVARLKEPALTFPFLSLLVSGGHSQLLLCEGVDSFHLLGGTHDDSVGEAYDKVARMLNLDASNMAAGEAVELAASKAPHQDPLEKKKRSFTVPLKGVKDCNFSFSGLKAQVFRSDLNNSEVVNTIAARFQDAAVAHLAERTMRALSWCSSAEVPVKSLAVVGGVARNAAIRRRLAQVCNEQGISLVVPPQELCTDNGVMIAWTGVEQLLAGVAKPQTELQIQPRWQLDDTFNPRKFIR